MLIRIVASWLRFILSLLQAYYFIYSFENAQNGVHYSTARHSNAPESKELSHAAR